MAPEVLSLHFRHKRGGALSRDLVSENEIGTHPSRINLKSLMQPWQLRHIPPLPLLHPLLLCDVQIQQHDHSHFRVQAGKCYQADPHRHTQVVVKQL